MSLSEGQVLNDRYRVTTLLGQSDSGAFYQAWDLTSNAECLIEEINDASEAAHQSFTQQAGRIYLLNHPGLPKYSEAFHIPGQGLYLVRPFIEGHSLQSMFDQVDGPLSQEVVIPTVLHVCDVLEYLHSQTPPIVHGDIRPSNILVSGSPEKPGDTFLIGMGVSTKYDSQTGTIVGSRAISPGFSPPESYGKGKIDARTDIYALGASLYFLLAGKRLPESVLIKGKDVLPPKPPQEFNSQLSPSISAAIMRAIQVDPEVRFNNIAEFRNALHVPSPEVKPTRVPKSGPRPAIIIGAIVLGIVLLTLLLGSGWLAARYFLAKATVTPPPSTASTNTAATAAVQSTVTSTPILATDTATVPPPPTELPSQIKDGRGVSMALVVAGEFTMGSEYGAPDEAPEHLVVLDSYYIDVNEVTNSSYQVCVNEGACDPPLDSASATNPSYFGNPDFSDFPVLMVTWTMALDYCSWREASLPTEAQWEKAARGTDLRIFPWSGEEANCSLANFWNNEPACQHDTTLVGSYPSGQSPFGLFDMAGNVWEWVMDWFDPNYYAGSPRENPTGPEQGVHRVVRGGAFSGSVNQIYVTTRGRNLPSNGYNYVGFRCVRPAP